MFILPVEGDNPTRHRHYVVWTLIAVCFTVFITTLFQGREDFIYEWGYKPGQYSLLTVFTSMFVHGGHWHILGNMFWLWMFGDNIEDVLGHFLFLICYFLCGVGAILMYTQIHPGSMIPVVGASGAISGIAGMYLMFFPRVDAELVLFIFRWEVHSIRTTIYVAVGCWFLMQLALGILVESTSVGEVIRTAFSGHVGGFLTGTALGWIFVRMGFIKRYISCRKRHWLLGYAT